jgi:hypothetical protein
VDWCSFYTITIHLSSTTVSWFYWNFIKFSTIYILLVHNFYCAGCDNRTPNLILILMKLD